MDRVKSEVYILTVKRVSAITFGNIQRELCMKLVFYAKLIVNLYDILLLLFYLYMNIDKTQMKEN